MKQLTVLSGKGGTGKTTLAASFAVLAKNSVVVDCDVDAPDLHMLLHPEIIESHHFSGSKIAVIEEAKCTRCGLCKEKCVFDAISQNLVLDSIACEGCGVCELICPVKAVTLVERISGSYYVSETESGFMVHAMLYPGEPNSGKLVTEIRQNARSLADKKCSDLIIIDGPPGIGCPVIASITGVDAALVVTEPTLSGIHDLKRALKLLDHFSIIPSVCVNMYDINTNNTNKILGFCQDNRIDVVGVIPFNSIVTKSMVNGKTVVEYCPESAVTEEITKMWSQLSLLLGLDL